jgi:hypothetical protein
MLASDVLTRARLVLNDIDKVRWLDEEGFQWLTDGQRTIVLVRPDACVANIVDPLVPGTRQEIPTGGFRLLDIMRNAPNGATIGGRSVRLVDRDVMDTQNPAWHTGTPSLVITNFIFDNRDPTVYYVYPPAAPGAKLEIIYSKAPTTVAALTDILSLTDIYIDPLLNYLLFRCYSKDAQFAQNAQLASAYLQTFLGMLGVKTKKDAAYSPDLNPKGANPNPAALQMEGV